MDEIDGPEGIGGWLAFFMIVMALISPVRALVDMLGLYADPAIAVGYGESWRVIEIAEWTLFGLVIAGSWYLVWRLSSMRTWKTVRIVVAGIWLLSVGGVLAELVLVTAVTGLPVGSLLQEMGFDAARPILFSAVWTAYFLVSKRVANTYSRHPDEDELANVFS